MWSVRLRRVRPGVRPHGLFSNREPSAAEPRRAARRSKPSVPCPDGEIIHHVAAPAGGGHVMLLAITNHLSQNVAAIPFLWVLPLSIYLLTFILCFEGDGWYRRNPYLQLLAVALGSMAYAVSVDMTSNVPIKVMIPLFAMGLFTCCMVCHGELARLKPDPKYLTHFFLMISAGGALGGLLVGFAAPHLFNALYEMPLSLVACAVLIAYVLRQDPELKWVRRWPGVVTSAVLTLALTGYVGWQIKRDGPRIAGVGPQFLRRPASSGQRRTGFARSHAHPHPRNHQPRRRVSQHRAARPPDHLLRTEYRRRHRHPRKTEDRRHPHRRDRPRHRHHGGLRPAGRLYPVLRDQSAGSPVGQEGILLSGRLQGEAGCRHGRRPPLAGAGSRRRISTCWRSTPFRAIPFPSTC